MAGGTICIICSSNSKARIQRRQRLGIQICDSDCRIHESRYSTTSSRVGVSLAQDGGATACGFAAVGSVVVKLDLVARKESARGSGSSRRLCCNMASGDFICMLLGRGDAGLRSVSARFAAGVRVYGEADVPS